MPAHASKASRRLLAACLAAPLSAQAAAPQPADVSAAFGNTLLTIDPDGRVRLALCGSDPGHPNWLDTEGRDEILCTIRWFRPPSDPFVRAERVPIEDVTTSAVDGAGRRNEIEARAAHAAWRYRT